MELYQRLPPEVVKIALVLFLSFLIGLEREEHKAAGGSYSFGGVRTFPLIGLIHSGTAKQSCSKGECLSSTSVELGKEDVSSFSRRFANLRSLALQFLCIRRKLHG